jgi:hypothetical protein
MMFQQIPCKFCGHIIFLNEDNRLTDIKRLDDPDVIGWCSNCGTFYTRKVNTPLADRWEVPHYAKQFVKQVF